MGIMISLIYYFSVKAYVAGIHKCHLFRPKIVFKLMDMQSTMAQLIER